jgi:hypothetical protein
MDDYSEFVPNVHFELIPIKSLVSNQDYQRNLSKTHIRRTSENFDLNQINPVKVSRRDGINYVFNGQHTIEIVATVSGSRDTPVWCMIYDELDYTQEADTFANQQNSSSRWFRMKFSWQIWRRERRAAYDKISGGILRPAGRILPLPGRHLCGVFAGVHTGEVWLSCTGTGLSGSVWHLGRRNELVVLQYAKRHCPSIVAFEDEMRDDVFKDKVGRYSAKEISRTAKERRLALSAMPKPY